MANQSIYSESWINLVFENRNKEYGAYQLRNENPKTTLIAISIGLLLILTVVGTPFIMNQFGTDAQVINEPQPYALPVQIKDVLFQPKKTPETKAAAPLTQKENQQSKPNVTQSNLVNPTITKAQEATANITPNTELQDSYVEPVEGAQLGTQSGGVLGGTGTDSSPNSGSESGNGTTIIGTTALDKQPEFPGGIKKFYAYVGRNFKTPDTDIAKTIKVYVSFVIEKDGTMTDIRVPRNPGFGLDQEAIRVLKSLKTKWSPGILNGEPVRTAYNLPIVVEQK